jgi:hypothetical protein
MPLDPATAGLIAKLATMVIDAVVALIRNGQLTDADVAKIESAIALRKKIKDEWDSLDPDNPT